MVLSEVLFRQTVDIDVVGTVYHELSPLMEKYDINSRINAFSDCLPYNYEDRLVKLELGTKRIYYYILSLEDLVVLKLFSPREKDRADITSESVLSKIDWHKLDQIVTNGELDNWFDRRKYDLFLEKYNEYVREYKKWDN